MNDDMAILLIKKLKFYGRLQDDAMDYSCITDAGDWNLSRESVFAVGNEQQLSPR